MYRIVWCTTHNALGETRFLDVASKENMMLWIMLNHEALAMKSAGYSVYLVKDEDELNETIWNWQPDDAAMCFGKLFKAGFPAMIHLVRGELHVYRDVLSYVSDEPCITLEPDEFAGLISDL